MSDLYIELNENRKSHAIIIGSDDRFTSLPLSGCDVFLAPLHLVRLPCL